MKNEAEAVLRCRLAAGIVGNMPSLAYLRECFDLDAETGDLIWKRRPEHHFSTLQRMRNHHARFVGKIAGNVCKRRGGKVYRDIQIAGLKIGAHRIAYALSSGTLPDPDLPVDHQDGGGTNNAPFNLRNVTQAENMKNTRLSSRNKSGVIGVSWDACRGFWFASIRTGGKTTSLGRFSALEDAAAARRAAEARLGFHPNHGSAAPIENNTTEGATA